MSNLSKTKAAVKRAIAFSGLRPSRTLSFVHGLIKLGRWVKANRPFPEFPHRFDLYRHILDSVIGDGPVSYLEFGVFKGESLKKWVELNRHPDSRFVGFDSFEGLPEDWEHLFGKTRTGTFDVDGQLPAIDDDRVAFVKGYFQDSLAGFLKERGSEVNEHPLVLHLDADLYSSTLYVLAMMDHYVVPGTVLVFDEFVSVLHEFRALEDYASSYCREYEVVGASGLSFNQVAVTITK